MWLAVELVADIDVHTGAGFAGSIWASPGTDPGEWPLLDPDPMESA